MFLIMCVIQCYTCASLLTSSSSWSNNFYNFKAVVGISDILKSVQQQWYRMKISLISDNNDTDTAYAIEGLWLTFIIEENNFKN